MTGKHEYQSLGEDCREFDTFDRKYSKLCEMIRKTHNLCLEVEGITERAIIVFDKINNRMENCRDEEIIMVKEDSIEYVVAQTIYGEARGEYEGPSKGIASLTDKVGLAGLIAVANVICNRAKRSGKTPKEECLEPKQFSCWNAGDPNLEVIKNVTDDYPVFKVCLDVASNVISGQWPDLTRGSRHYYASYMKAPPKWAEGHKPVCRIGGHLFFNDVI